MHNHRQGGYPLDLDEYLRSQPTALHNFTLTILTQTSPQKMVMKSRESF